MKTNRLVIFPKKLNILKTKIDGSLFLNFYILNNKDKIDSLLLTDSKFAPWTDPHFFFP